jgi:hypothetical protein
MRLFEIFESKDKHFSASSELDASLNPESSNYKEEEEKKTINTDNETPIHTSDVDNGEEDWTTQPEKDQAQSAGFRGREEAKANAGIPHQPYQKHDPSFVYTDSPVDVR